MLPYVLRRMGVAFVTFLLASVLIFAIIQLPPGDFVSYAISQSGDAGGGGEAMERMREFYGLDQPAHRQYFRWIGGVLQGNLGYSFLYKKPVMQLIGQDFFWTVFITGISFLLAFLLGMAIGVYSALRKYTMGDYLVTLVGFVGLSAPPFFVAIILIYLLVTTGQGYTGGLYSSAFVAAPWSWAKFLDLMRHIWVPIAVLTFSNIPQVIRIMRTSMLEVLSQPYVLTAKAKGLKRRHVVVRHGVRLAMNPLISLAGLMLPKLISGIVVTAVVLNLPVMGPTFIESLKSQDMYLAGGYLMLAVILLLAGNLIADIVLAWTDPRIRLEK